MFGNNVWAAAASRRCASTCRELTDDALSGSNRPGKVFDPTLPLAEVAEGYTAIRAPGDQDPAAAVTRVAGSSLPAAALSLDGARARLRPGSAPSRHRPFTTEVSVDVVRPSATLRHPS